MKILVLVGDLFTLVPELEKKPSADPARASVRAVSKRNCSPRSDGLGSAEPLLVVRGRGHERQGARVLAREHGVKRMKNNGFHDLLTKFAPCTTSPGARS